MAENHQFNGSPDASYGEPSTSSQHQASYDEHNEFSDDCNRSSDECNESFDECNEESSDDEHNESSNERKKESSDESKDSSNKCDEFSDSESKNPQPLSIQWLDTVKIVKHIKCKNEDSGQLNVDEAIKQIIANYNNDSLLEQGKKRKKMLGKYNEKINAYILQTKRSNDVKNYKRKTYKWINAESSILGDEVDDSSEENISSHRVLFFYRNEARPGSEPLPIIFALTNGRGFEVVKKYVDHSFPIKVIEKVGNAKKIIVSEKRRLFGENIKEVVYIETKYECERDCTLDLYYLVESLMCEIKSNSSLAGKLPPPTKIKRELIDLLKILQEEMKSTHGEVPLDQLKQLLLPTMISQLSTKKRRNETSKITVRTSGILRIERRIDLFDYPDIFDLLVKYMLDEETYNGEGVLEEKDSSFAFLHFLSPANQPREIMNAHLIQEIFHQYQTREETEFHVYHKFLKDFLSSNRFDLKIFRKSRFEKIGEKPPTLEKILSKIDESDKNRFIKTFLKSKLRFYKGGKVYKSEPLINYIEGELHVDENSYFKLRNMWYGLTADYTAHLHKDFKNLIKTYSIKRESVAFLPRPWGLNEDEGRYNRAYLKSPYGPSNGYLVFDEVFDLYYASTEIVECCDILKRTEDSVYLYHVKEKFGRDTRDAASQMLNAAKLIRSSISLKQSENYLQRLWAFATMIRDNPTTEESDVKTAMEESFQNATEFINLFCRRRIVFVYAHCPSSPNRSLLKELEKYYVTPDTFIPVAPGNTEVLFRKLIELGYLDSFGNLMGKFCCLKKEKFILDEQFRERSGAIFDLMKEYRSISKSTIGKLELVQVASDLKKLGFDFGICEIDRTPKIRKKKETQSSSKKAQSQSTSKKTKTQSTSKKTESQSSSKKTGTQSSSEKRGTQSSSKKRKTQ